MAQQKKLRASYEELQNAVAGLQQQVGMMDYQLRGAVQHNSEVLGAVVSLLGDESVTKELNRLREERRLAAEEKAVENTKKLIETGILKPAETSTEKSFLVGRDNLKDGTSRYVQFEVQQVPEQDRPKYVGLKAGAEVKNDEAGVTFLVVDVYDIDVERAVAYQEEQAKKAREAAAAAEASKPAAEPTPEPTPDQA